MKKEIILASGSPRRRELLNQIGIDFTVITSDADEITTEKSPEKIVMQLSSLKAEAVAKLPVKKNTAAVQNSAAASFGDSDSYVIIGADTIVYADGQVLGKPRDERHAFDMIKVFRAAATVYIRELHLFVEKKKRHFMNRQKFMYMI